jgi:pimeloyl-ACP methyl ester carboxylesterase
VAVTASQRVADDRDDALVLLEREDHRLAHDVLLTLRKGRGVTAGPRRRTVIHLVAAATDTAYARASGVNIAYQVLGEGATDLVFIPGFVSGVELVWEEPSVARFFRRLTSFARLIIFDKRGQGMSDRPGRPPTLEESMDDVRSVMDAAGSERAALFGISEGGPMAALFAAHPDRARSLVLYGTYARLLEAPGYPEGIAGDRFDRLTETIRREWGGPVGLPLWAPGAVGDPGFARRWARLLRQGTSPSGAIDLLDLYRELDVRAALGAIRVPTLVLHRTGDRLVPARMGRYLADHIPSATDVELEGDDHLAFVGDQDVLLDEVEELVAGSRRAREPDRVLGTVLFTDIVGSTERAAELGDRRWRDLLVSHDAVVRRQLELHRGREVKTMGDGFLATFDGPARAIRAAMVIEHAAGELGLGIRAGIHTGELEVIGDDVGGMAVSIGAGRGARGVQGGPGLEHRQGAGRRLGDRVP